MCKCERSLCASRSNHMYKYCQSVSVDNHLIYTIFLFSIFFWRVLLEEKKNRIRWFRCPFSLWKHNYWKREIDYSREEKKSSTGISNSLVRHLSKSANMTMKYYVNQTWFLWIFREKKLWFYLVCFSHSTIDILYIDTQIQYRSSIIAYWLIRCSVTLMPLNALYCCCYVRCIDYRVAPS